MKRRNIGSVMIKRVALVLCIVIITVLFCNAAVFANDNGRSSKMNRLDLIDHLTGTSYKPAVISIAKDDWSYSLDDDKNATITGYSGDSETIQVPSEIDGNKVIAIGNDTFKNNKKLYSVVISDGIESIGASAFEGCSNMYSVSIPDSVESIGPDIFHDCDSLMDVTLGTGITAIPDSAFEHCDSLEFVVLPYHVVSIGNTAFKDCVRFVGITIPRATTSISTTAFSYTDKLTIYGVEGTYAETFANDNGISFVNRQINAESVILSSKEITIYTGRSAKLTFTASPVDFTDEVSWKSANTNIAMIANDGTLKGVAAGTTTIKLVVGNVSATCKVTVVKSVTNISLNSSSLQMSVLETFQLKATVKPIDAFNTAVSWSSSDNTVASVDNNGLVTALKKGTAVITVSAMDGSGITSECNINVTNYSYICSSVSELESPHNYENNCSDSWTYQIEGAKRLSVTFDERTETEDDFDYLCIYDGDDILTGKYTGTALAGQTVDVSGDTIRIQIISDASVTEWGFKVTKISSEIRTGWQKISGKWYYYSSSGVMQIDWQKINGKWYYFNSSGVMVTGWQTINDKTYYFSSSGAMVTGWQTISNKTYYFNSSGAMVTGWQKIDSNWYYFNSSGAMLTGFQTISKKTYLFNSSGVMQTGWHKIDGKTYFFKASGIMAANEWCEGYWLNADGTWTYKYKASWKSSSKGTWYGDTSGWYAKNQTLMIDDVAYTFDTKGYLVE